MTEAESPANSLAPGSLGSEGIGGEAPEEQEGRKAEPELGFYNFPRAKGSGPATRGQAREVKNSSMR